MQKNYLSKRLVLPLSIAAISSLVIGYFVPWQGLFINLAATFIGILITVFYVDLILRKHEETRWINVKVRVHGRIERMANLSIGAFRSAYGLGTDIFGKSFLETDDRTEIRSMIAHAAENVIIPITPTRLNDVNQAEWKKVVQLLNSVVQMGDELVALFGDRIEPEIFSLIVETHDKAEGILAMYWAIPEVFGNEAEVFLASDTNTLSASKQSSRRLMTKDAQELLSLAATLLRRL
jgi:hypothetical protein